MKKINFLTGFRFLFFLTFMILLISSCQREIDNPVDTGSTNGVNDNIMVTAGIRGTVIDEFSQPVSGATVSSGSNTTTTDRYGVFRFSNISLSKANGYVKVVKQGYFTGSRTFVSTAGRIHNVRIKLLPKSVSGTFDAAAGGSITISGGGKLVMPAAAVTDASGNVYTGMVNVAMTWIDPTASNLPEILIGDLRGITTTGEERGLETFGMLGVEMTSTTGLPLKIATGKTAELTFPIPAAISANAPATIDLWHFDEVKGRWMQEGIATKTGSNYLAQVSHFSFWNCDAPFPLINFCMTLVNNSNNQPLINTQVRIKRANGSYGSGWTDSTGRVCGKIPKNEALTLQVMDQCNNVAHSQGIGPFSSDVDLGVISVNIPAANSLIITGTITNCSNANVTSGVAVIYATGGFSYAVPVSNGTFTFTMLRCSGTAINFSVLGIDYTAMQQSVPVSGTGTTGTVNVGTIQACGTSSAQFMEFLIDGTPYNYVSPPDFFNYSDSSAVGPYSNKTWIAGFSQNPGTTSYSSLSFNNNSAIANGLPLNNVSINFGPVFSSQILTVSPTINVTNFGVPTTGFVEGNFSIQMNFSGIPKNVICAFRVRRN